jgi:hypothetical protein
VPFGYYERLSAKRKRIYDQSDRLLRIEWPDVQALEPLALAIQPALEDARRAQVEKACQALLDAMNAQLRTPPVVMRVLERRPSNDTGELQGLYEPDEVTGGKARITVWMRTAAKEQVVKFRTFLRTVVHEACHHFDYEHYKLAETFHTQGFYTRESILMKELLGEARPDSGR